MEKDKQKDRSWIADVLFYFPEIIWLAIRGIVRGLLNLFKWVN